LVREHAGTYDRAPMGARVFRLQVPAEAKSLGCLRSFLAAALEALPHAFVDCVVLAVDEACANVVRHRRSDLGCREIDLTVEVTDDRIRCRIGSFCTRDDLPAIRPRAASGEGGLGTHLIGCVMDRVDYEPDPARPGALVLVLEKHLPQGAGP
jgi:sigma-B regulation protein RsbU (phosphoserine phosphatase)